MKSSLQNVALFLVACAVALGGIEIGLRIWGPDVLALGNQYVFYRFDPVLGWDGLPGADGQFSRSEFSYRVTMNSDGLWDAELKPKQHGEFRVAVLGDSFTWGIGAAYGQRFTEVVEQREPTINVLNFGVAGFSPIQYLLQLDRVLTFKPDYVVVALCLGNDPTDNVKHTPYNHPKPYVAPTDDGNGYVVKGYPLLEMKTTGTFLTGGSSVSRIIGIIEFIYYEKTKPRGEGDAVEPARLYVPPEKASAAVAKITKEVFKLNELVLADMKKKIDAALGPGHFAVLLVPTRFEVGLDFIYPDSDRNYVGDQVKASLARLEIPAVDGRPVITEGDFWKTDAHWRPSGHAKIGVLLENFLAVAREGINTPASSRAN